MRELVLFLDGHDEGLLRCVDETGNLAIGAVERILLWCGRLLDGDTTHAEPAAAVTAVPHAGRGLRLRLRHRAT